MTTLGHCALPIFLWSIAAAWVAASPLQTGQSVMQRNQYGPMAAEILAAYLEDHDPTEQRKPVEEESRSDRDREWLGDRRPPKGFASTTEAGVARFDRNLDQIGGGNLVRSTDDRYSRNLDQIGGGNLVRSTDDRYTRNLDQIGGGNLVRSTDDRYSRNLDQIGGGNLVRSTDDRYTRNLDQIGGGNLVRSMNDRYSRNLDQIGGGNLVRSLNGARDEFRRNLDQIGGGNLVRNLARAARQFQSRTAETESRDTIDAGQ
ncbi:uncharacterized protein LOC143214050 isoform X1 [Lasioglossum baleicum]|uniref:uncharacterized protein LOC143214050 isoform X1 n=1 Tax=Lasioglossum baleicum TaxID=434251 RepID=UPI003FCC82A5